MLKGQLFLPAASSVAGTPSSSQPLNLQGWDGSNPTTFQWLVNDAGKLNLLTAAGTNPTADSGLTVASNGTISFAPGQTFPGTQTSLGAGPGISISGNTVANTGVLSVAAGNSGIIVGGPPTNRTISNAGVVSFNGRAGPVAAAVGDYSFAQIAGQLTPGQAAPGTYGISINGTAATATTAGTANTAALASNATALGGVAPANYARVDVGNAFTGNQTVNGNATVSGNVVANGSVTIGAGAAISKHMSTTVSVSFSPLKPGGCSQVQFSDTRLVGAADGDTVALGVSTALMSAAGIPMYTAWVTGSGTITIRACNLDPSTNQKTGVAGTIRVDVWKH
jgi:hypothetical protein